MKKLLLLAVWLTVSVGYAFDCGCPVPCAKPCKIRCPKPCYTTITVTEKVMVPVKSWQIVEKEVPCIVYQDVTKEVPITVRKTFWEDKEFPVKKPVMVDTEITEKVVTNKIVEEQRTRTVCKLVPATFEKEITRCTYTKSCDPCTGRTVKIPMQYVEKIPCVTYNQVTEEVPYTVKICVPEITEVKKTVKVCKWEDSVSIIKVAVCKDVQETRTVCVKEPVTIMKKVCERVPVITYQEVEKCVRKKVPACSPCGGEIVNAIPATPLTPAVKVEPAKTEKK